MDWLRSENLKEEKVETTPVVIVGALIVENNVEKRTVNLQGVASVIINET